MSGSTRFGARVVRVCARLYSRKWLSVAMFFAIFLTSIGLLAHFNLLPDPPQKPPLVPLAEGNALSAPVGGSAASSTPAAPELPEKVIIPKIGLTANISNPVTTDPNVLDKLLLQGAVRYPTSAELGQTGNVVIFGHSSYLPIVGDEAYKTFDGIQKLVAGDTIAVYSSDRVYLYAVRTMEKESINDAVIPLSVSGQVLTLSTCNSFTGTKTDRFVVTADFVESRSL